MPMTHQPTGEIYSISALNREVRYLLENSFSTIWVEGEISNFAAPHSGHWYFSLKDNSAQVRCAMFRPHNRLLTFTPNDGMHVLAKARISLYEGRGEYQLIVEFIEDAGKGKLQKAFEELKKRLAEAGLFNAAHKKSLPPIPRCIGVITSPTGAAIQDILTILQRRFPAIPVIIYPTLVQGDSAAPNIVKMIQIANTRQECDVLILARGGGSLEDLWPFNEETVAYAVYHSEIPIVTGVGHEIDFTIVDFVSDLRAPTPSAAAELIAPAMSDLLLSLKQKEYHLTRSMKQRLNQWQQQLGWIFKHLQQQHPKQRLRERAQQLDLLTMELQRHLIHTLHQHQNTLGKLASKLDALSPLATLKRGYAIATRTKDQQVLRNSNEVTQGDIIEVRLNEGLLDCVVDQVR